MIKTVLKFLKEPGSYRILFGGFIVIVLLILALFGDKLVKYHPSEMDSANIMSPPSLTLFRSFLITDKGLKNLGLKPTELVEPKAKASPDKNNNLAKTSEYEGDEDLDYLEADDQPYQNEATLPSSSPATSSEYTDDEEFGYLENEKTSAPKSPQVQKSPHIFGTDKDGRDLLSLIIAGVKNCILPGLLACLVALGLGIPMGILGGYYGKNVAGAVQMFNGIMLSFPRFVLILVVICALEPNVYYTMIVLGLTIVPRISELMRTRVGMLSKLGFITAAKESGLSDFKIMTRHLFWYSNRTIFFIQASLVMAESILVETTLSYLQFGTKAPDVSWGNIIEGSRMSFFSEYYWITFFPAISIVIAILGFYYLGDGMNDRMEYNERR